SDFYQSYSAFKKYETPGLSSKDIARFDDEVWHPAAFERDMRVLELGCGTGQFLAWLEARGVQDMVGIDHDPEVIAVAPDAIRGRIIIQDVRDWLRQTADDRPFDRIVLMDVLEHFTASDGMSLIRDLAVR
ncbi:unnamed protein product, partial [Ectocarpus sp. 8 AP-2014]